MYDVLNGLVPLWISVGKVCFVHNVFECCNLFTASKKLIFTLIFLKLCFFFSWLSSCLASIWCKLWSFFLSFSSLLTNKKAKIILRKCHSIACPIFVLMFMDTYGAFQLSELKNIKKYPFFFFFVKLSRSELNTWHKLCKCLLLIELWGITSSALFLFQMDHHFCFCVFGIILSCTLLFASVTLVFLGCLMLLLMVSEGLKEHWSGLWRRKHWFDGFGFPSCSWWW